MAHTHTQHNNRQTEITLSFFPIKWRINQESEGENQVCQNRSIIYPVVVASKPLSITLKHMQE